MIIGTNIPKTSGQRYDAWSDEAQGNVPYFVLREATYEEWLREFMERPLESRTPEEIRLVLNEKARVDYHFYDVSVD
jgi:hypothetical protein